MTLQDFFAICDRVEKKEIVYVERDDGLKAKILGTLRGAQSFWVEVWGSGKLEAWHHAEVKGETPQP